MTGAARKQLREAMPDHLRKVETDPEYRAETEKFRNLIVTFGNDTAD